ncbi:MAG: hypothetical protein HDT39_17390 [Lachnospiraceae bacterium]|nr:hypothetical protein [Lachnospiraceae bacterium]
MEVIKKKFKIEMIIITTFCTMLIFSGCGKKFWDYECVWVSDSPYIYMPANSHAVIIEINGEKKIADTGWKHTGLGITFYDPEIDNGTTMESIIWETECEIKKGKLYITIIKDNVSDMEGKTIILEQQPLENESDLQNHNIFTHPVLEPQYLDDESDEE